MRTKPHTRDLPTGRLVRYGRVLALLIAVAPLGVATPSSADVSDGSATLSGRAVAGNRPLAGATVSLIAIAASGPQVRTATCDAEGRFTFPGLTAGSAITYTATTVYQRATFTSDGLTLTAGQVRDITLDVVPTTISTAAVTLTSWTVWVDFSNGKMAVQQDVEYRNKGSAAFVGTIRVPVADGSGLGAVQLPVAPGATNYEYLGRFQSCCAAASGGIWTHIRPVTPGTSTGTVRYDAPPTDRLSFPAQFPVTAFAILVPAGTRVASPQLQPAGTETDRGITYQVYRGGPLAAGSVLSLSLGSPPRKIGPTEWVAGLVIVLLVGLIAWLAHRRRMRNRPPGSRSQAAAAAGGKAATPTTSVVSLAAGARSTPRVADPRAATGPATGTGGGEAGTHTEADAPGSHADPAELADELARLDLAFENGSLTDEATYRMIREALVQRLVAAVASDPSALR